jgi:hypothetical protein
MDVYKEWLGIPEGPRPPDHYELLRVRRFEDDGEKIRAHYKKLNAHVRKYATGQYSIQSQELLNEMAKAMLCLTDPERKRDYDESLGREFEPEKDVFGRMPLLDVLAAQGDISRDQKGDVESFAERRGLSIRDAVVQMKLVSAEQAARALARQLGFSFVDLEDMVPEDDALDRVPRQLVKKHSFIPLFVDDDRLLIACADEPEHELEDELRLRYGAPPRPVLATPRAINQAIAQYYAPGMRDEAKIESAVPLSGGKAAGKAPAKAASAKTAKEPGEVNKALLTIWIILIMSPVAFRLAGQFSNTVNSWLIIYPILGWLTILIPLIGGVATFVYFKFILPKK